MDPSQQASILLSMTPLRRDILHSVVRILSRGVVNLRRDSAGQELPRGFGYLSRVEQALWILLHGRNNYSNYISVIRLVLLAAAEM